MSDALKSRLSAERLFTAEDMAEAAYTAAWSALSVKLSTSGAKTDMAQQLSAAERASALDRVQRHLSSDTTTIRPLKG